MTPGWAEAVAALVKYIATPKGDGRRLVTTQLFHMLFEKLGNGELTDITAELKNNQVRRIRAKTLGEEADAALKVVQVYKVAEEAKAIANASSSSDSPGIVAARERAERAISRLAQDGGGLQLNGEQLRLMAETEKATSEAQKANEATVDAELPLKVQAEGEVSPTVIVEGVGVSSAVGTARAEGSVAGSAEPAPAPTHHVAASATSASEAMVAEVNAEGAPPAVVISDAEASQQRKVAADVARGDVAAPPNPPPPPSGD